ncbi:hypothetical protein TorRG33x02_159780 [Trema orientale]|uniref:Uncharacterized protein n=1 Tax=Trema orientale TaxID=63057 RepID=A0A2P5ERH2_TREOI|nr:hypothetical protein TorRG33x02_159780 [Trema orientale]
MDEGMAEDLGGCCGSAEIPVRADLGRAWSGLVESLVLARGGGQGQNSRWTKTLEKAHWHITISIMKVFLFT